MAAKKVTIDLVRVYTRSHDFERNIKRLELFTGRNYFLTNYNCEQVRGVWLANVVHDTMRCCHHPPVTDKGATTDVPQRAIVKNSQRDLPWPGMFWGILAANDTGGEVTFATP